MKKIFTLFVCIPLILLSTACSTICNGTSQNISISSKKLGQEIYINGKSTKIYTPSIVEVSRSKKDIEIATKDTVTGKKQSVVIESSITNSFYGNFSWMLAFVFPAIVAFSTDGITGAMWEYPENIVVE